MMRFRNQSMNNDDDENEILKFTAFDKAGKY